MDIDLLNWEKTTVEVEQQLEIYVGSRTVQTPDIEFENRNSRKTNWSAFCKSVTSEKNRFSCLSFELLSQVYGHFTLFILPPL